MKMAVALHVIAWIEIRKMVRHLELSLIMQILKFTIPMDTLKWWM